MKQKTIKQLTAQISSILKSYLNEDVVKDGRTFTGSLSPEKFGKQCKVSGPTIRNLMEGERVSLPTLISVANACGYVIEEIKLSKIN